MAKSQVQLRWIGLQAWLLAQQIRAVATAPLCAQCSQHRCAAALGYMGSIAALRPPRLTLASCTVPLQLAAAPWHPAQCTATCGSTTFDSSGSHVQNGDSAQSRGLPHKTVSEHANTCCFLTIKGLLCPTKQIASMLFVSQQVRRYRAHGHSACGEAHRLHMRRCTTKHA